MVVEIVNTFLVIGFMLVLLQLYCAAVIGLIMLACAGEKKPLWNIPSVWIDPNVNVTTWTMATSPDIPGPYIVIDDFGKQWQMGTTGGSYDGNTA